MKKQLLLSLSLLSFNALSTNTKIIITKQSLRTYKDNHNEMRKNNMDYILQRLGFKPVSESTITELSGQQRHIALAYLFNDVLHAPVNASHNNQ